MQEMSIQAGVEASHGAGVVTNLFGQTGVFHNVTNMMLFLIGAISVIMLIIGGLKYVVSGGDHGKVTEAKNTILYAIIGVIVAIMAYSIVAFVINSFSSGSVSF